MPLYRATAANARTEVADIVRSDAPSHYTPIQRLVRALTPNTYETIFEHADAPSITTFSIAPQAETPTERAARGASPQSTISWNVAALDDGPPPTYPALQLFTTLQDGTRADITNLIPQVETPPTPTTTTLGTVTNEVWAQQPGRSTGDWRSDISATINGRAYVFTLHFYSGTDIRLRTRGALPAGAALSDMNGIATTFTLTQTTTPPRTVEGESSAQWQTYTHGSASGYEIAVNLSVTGATEAFSWSSSLAVSTMTSWTVTRTTQTTAEAQQAHMGTAQVDTPQQDLAAEIIATNAGHHASAHAAYHYDIAAAITSFAHTERTGGLARTFAVNFQFSFAANTLAEATIAFAGQTIDLLSRSTGARPYRHIVGTGAPAHTWTQATDGGQPSITTGRGARTSNAVLTVRARTGAAATRSIPIQIPA